MKYIGDIDEKIIESAKKFASQGIDIFNPKDKFLMIYVIIMIIKMAKI